MSAAVVIGALRVKKNLYLLFEKDTVNSRYLEVEGTRWNTSRYPYFHISDVQKWVKYQTNNQITQMNMSSDSFS